MTTEILKLNEIAASQSQKELAHNTALRQIEAWVRALSQSTAAPTASPNAGDTYIVPAGATGAWAGQDHALAHYYGGSWKFYVPPKGVVVYVLDEDAEYAFDSTGTWAKQGGAVASVNGHTGTVTLTAADVGAEVAGAAAVAISAHDAAADPHPQYMTQAESDGRYALAGAAGSANGYATLDGGGKLNTAQLPDLAIVDFLGTVATQAAMLALSGQKGDWCIRSDNGKVYTITGSDPTQAASWTAMNYPAAAIPVFGPSGASHASGLVPDPGSTAGTTKFLREDGGWAVPPGTAPAGTTVDAEAFTASGTWTKPAGVSMVHVICVGAGGGGGGGQGGATSALRTGGSGGGGGSLVFATFRAADIGSTVAISVGAGGSAGAGGSSANGTAGGLGGNSSFGSLLTAYGGGGGFGGNGSNTAGGTGAGSAGAGATSLGGINTTGGLPASTAAAVGIAGQGGGGSSGSSGKQAEFGGGGGGGFNTSGVVGAGGSSLFGGPGGGAGGGLNASNTVGAAGAGGGVAMYATGGGGAAGTGSAGAAGTAGAAGNSTACGAGGGGGACNTAGTGGAGGAGGIVGGGGGGGGGGTSVGGAGGAGGGGAVFIYAW